jgi:SAM-dependent methyltransferase
MLRAFQAGGMRVLGVDPAQAIAERATAAGVETLSTYFTAELGRTIRRVRGPAAIVAANNVIANVDNLADVLDGVRSLLAPNGTFVFETSYWADVVEHALLDTVFHEHLSYFSVGPLQHYLRRHGMELVAVERIPTKGGSIRGTVRLADAAPAVEASVAELIAHEGRLGLRRLDTYESLRARLTAVASELHGLVDALKAEGNAVAGYGASVGITTLIYSFGLGRLLDFLVDDNPQKQGLFSPGWHLPVRGSAVLDEQRKADYVVLLAWRYAEPILRRHARFLAQGGRFIRVMPNVEIVSVGGVA